MSSRGRLTTKEFTCSCSSGFLRPNYEMKATATGLESTFAAEFRRGRCRGLQSRGIGPGASCFGSKECQEEANNWIPCEMRKEMVLLGYGAAQADLPIISGSPRTSGLAATKSGRTGQQKIRGLVRRIRSGEWSTSGWWKRDLLSCAGFG